MQLVEDFIETKRRLVMNLSKKAEDVAYYFPIIDFVEVLVICVFIIVENFR